MKNKKRMKKGLSLIELVIVLAIIGILTLIIAVAWNRIIIKQKINSANSNAKIIFNAAQTECIKYSTTERNKADQLMGNGAFYFYWDGHTAYSAKSATDIKSAGSSDKGIKQTAFATAINNILGDTDDEMVYAVYINNYVVQSVVYSPQSHSKYVGAYPLNLHDTLPTTDFMAKVELADYTADKITT